MQSPTSRAGRRVQPQSPPASPSTSKGFVPSKGLSDFFSAPLTPDTTPPPSLPTSPPLSPEVQKARLRKVSGRKLRGGIELAVNTEAAVDEVEDPASPILPKVRLAFPTIMSDEEEEEVAWSSRRYTTISGASDGKGKYEMGARPRTWSQKTTTTRRTEHRSVRYSMPSFEQVDDTGSSTAPSPPASGYSPRVSLPSSQSTSYLPTPSSPSSYSRRPTTSTSSASAGYARTTRTSLPSRRPTNSFSGSGPSGSARFDSTYRSASPSSASTFPRANRAKNYDASYDFRTPSSITPPPPPRNLSIDSLPFVKPFVNVFLLLLISTIACASVSAVLFTGFSLTFYDDCGKRVRLIRDGIGEGQKRVQDGIEGVRAGMGRMLGGAKGALGLAGWAAGAGAKRLTNGRERVSFARKGPAPSPVEGEEGYLGPTFKNYSRGRSRSRRRKSCSPSVGGPPRFDAAKEIPPMANPDEGAGAWQSDEDAMPYDVPPSTPRRSPSPSSRRPHLPPRPPMRILIPSIILALLYTLSKVAWGVWMGQPWRQSPPHRSSESEEEEEEE